MRATKCAQPNARNQMRATKCAQPNARNQMRATKCAQPMRTTNAHKPKVFPSCCKGRYRWPLVPQITSDFYRAANKPTQISIVFARLSMGEFPDISITGHDAICRTP
jgi:hypothetical protein